MLLSSFLPSSFWSCEQATIEDNPNNTANDANNFFTFFVLPFNMAIEFFEKDLPPNR